MVTTLNITLDDAIANKARRVKDDRGLTWAEFIEVAADELQELESKDRRDRESSQLIEWVETNQPVSKEAILENCVPDDFPGKPESWWERHGRDELKKHGGEFTRNVGWKISRKK